jgi:hypothetical protein
LRDQILRQGEVEEVGAQLSGRASRPGA